MLKMNQQRAGEAFNAEAPRWGTYNTITPQFRKNAQPPHEEVSVLNRAYNMNSWS